MKRGAENWLNGVEKILRASTGNLRELAELAGVDPTTLYIGTSMNGVDVRGQDLRGMKFTALDAETITIDASTLVDAEQIVNAHAIQVQEAETLNSDDAPLLYFVGNRGPLPKEQDYYNRLSGYKLFRPNEDEAFVAASKKSNNPKFVIFHILDADTAISITQRVGPDAVGLTTTSALTPTQLGRWSRAIREIGSLVLVAPTGNSGRTFTPNHTVSSEMIDAIKFMAGNISARKSAANTGRPLIFMRARGLAPDPLLDAWCQLYSRAARLRFTMGLGVKASKYRFSNKSYAEDASHLLFPELRPIGSASINADAVVLSEAAHSTTNTTDEPPFAILEGLGWEIGHSAIKTEDWEIIPRHGPAISFRFGTSADVQRKKFYTEKEIEEFEIRNVRTITVCEDANVDVVLNRLIEANELWISPRDLSAYRADAGAIWMLFASQLRRMSGTFSTQNRTRYFELLLRAALKGTDYVPDKFPLIEILSHSPFSELFEVTAAHTRFYDVHAQCVLRITPTVRNTGYLKDEGEIARVTVDITPTGVNVAYIALRSDRAWARPA